MPTIEQSLVKLSLAKRQLLEDLAEKHRLMEITHTDYCEAVDKCHRVGLSFGQMAYAVGGLKEGIWRSWRRWLKRQAK